MENDKRVEQKRRELSRVFAGLSDNEKQVAGDLIDNAAFMSVLLEDLAKDIRENGTTEEYSNGATQHGRKISSSVKSYTSLINKYNAVISRLLGLIPEDSRPVRRETPETKLYSSIEHTDENAAAAVKRQKIDQDFLNALGAGKVTQGDYDDFTKEALGKM